MIEYIFVNKHYVRSPNITSSLLIKLYSVRLIKLWIKRTKSNKIIEVINYQMRISYI